MFDVFVYINGVPGPAIVTLATDNDITQLQSWKGEYATYTDQQTVDVLEYTADTLHKHEAYAKYNRCPASWEDFHTQVTADSEEEVAGIFVLKCQALVNSILGFVFVRRCWDGDLVMDYLVARPRPDELGEPPLTLKGIGTALFFSVCQIAESYNAPKVWWETTPESISFYLNLLGLPRLKKASRIDLIKEEYRTFINRFS